MQTPNQDTAHQLAQELINKTRQIKNLACEVDLLKIEIFDETQRGIQHVGGKVFFVDSNTALQLYREHLKGELIARFQLTEQGATSFIDSCKAPRERPAFIAAHLD